MRKILLWLVATGLLVVVSPAVGKARERGHDIRWDLVQIVQGTVLAGGTDAGQDAASQDTVSLTGSGSADPDERGATGGGLFVHKHANGTEVAHGVYVVTGLVRWRPAGGSLTPAGVADGIGHLSETRAGILRMTVRLFPAGALPGTHADGILTVNCALPGETFAITEGITLAVGPFHFTQHGGGTLFHVQHDGEDD